MGEFNQNLFNLLEEAESYETRSRDEYIRAPFGWPGGKSRSLDKILPKLPVRKGYIEPCGGSGIVLLNRPQCELEVYNDRYSGVVAFFRCIREPAKCDALVDRLRSTVHSREEFIWCRDSWTNCQDDVERAARWYYMLRVSFSQLGRNFGRATYGRPQQAKALQNSLKLFPAISKRFELVQVENQDAIQCIIDFDHSDHVFYVDPDYMGTDPGIYAHRVEHIRMLDTIFRGKGFYAVSAYSNELYESYPWDDRIEWEVMVSATGQAFVNGNLVGKENVMTRSKKATEVLYIKESV